jgi:hypothetical protein
MEGLGWLRSSIAGVPRSYSRKSRRSCAGRRQPTTNGIRSSSNWVAICAKFGQDSTGGWTMSAHSTSSWKRSSRNLDARPTTMAIHEQLPQIPKVDLQQVGWAKATELAKVTKRDSQRFESAPWLHKAPRTAQRRVQTRSLEAPDRQGHRAVGDPVFQSLETGKQDALLPSLTRLVIGLPKPQRK